MYVYDGNSNAAPLLAKLSGKLNEGTFQSYNGQHTGYVDSDGNIMSTSNEMFVNFQSDDSEAWNGFKIQFDGGNIFRSIRSLSYIVIPFYENGD